MIDQHALVVPAVFGAIFISSAALAEQAADESVYVEIDTLELERITQDKLDACLLASGNNTFCQCLIGKLPVGLTFNGYILSVTKSRQQLGYNELSDAERNMIDSALSVRNQCVTGSEDIEALIDATPPSDSSAEKQTASSAGSKKVGKATATAASGSTQSSSTVHDGYLVQAASFKRQKDAEDIASLLSENGMDAHLTEVDLPKRGHWYRVYLGPYTDRDVAEQLVTVLRSSYHLSAWLQKISKP